jgi:hypothetical protein
MIFLLARNHETLEGVKIVQKKVNNGVAKIRPRIKTNIFPRNNSESLTWSAKSQQKVSIADCQTFSDSIDEKSAGNLNLYYFDAL